MSLVLTDVRTCWEAIVPGVQTVLDQVPGRYRPEDVYAALVNGSAWLYRGAGGFVVLQARGGELLVWLAFSAVPGAVARYQAELDELARAGGFRRLVMESNRAGWVRVPGWEPVGIVYERVIE